MRDGTRAFFFTILEHLENSEILHTCIFSLTGKILRQLFPSVSVPSEKYSRLGRICFTILKRRSNTYRSTAAKFVCTPCSLVSGLRLVGLISGSVTVLASVENISQVIQ